MKDKELKLEDVEASHKIEGTGKVVPKEREMCFAIFFFFKQRF